MIIQNFCGRGNSGNYLLLSIKINKQPERKTALWEDIQTTRTFSAGRFR